MHITITGDLGSGKSTVCRLLKDTLGFNVESSGSIFRDIAMQKGLSVAELNAQINASLDTAHEVDDLIDNRTKELAKLETPVLIDSRMGWFFVPNSYKVFITVDPVVAAKRIYNDAKRAGSEHYSSEAECLEKVLARRNSEKERFLKLYGVDYTDWSNYDLVIDSTEVSAESIARAVSRASYYTEKCLCICPKRLYPTQVLRDVNPDLVTEYRKTLEYLLTPIKVAKKDSKLFIIDGHHRAVAAILDSHGYVPAVLVESNPTVLTKSDYYDWEDYTGMRFTVYPEG